MSFANLFSGKPDDSVKDLFNVDAKPVDRSNLLQSRTVLNVKRDDISSSDSSDSDSDSTPKPTQRNDENYDLEAKYFKKLLDEDKPQPKSDSKEQSDSEEPKSDSEDEPEPAAGTAVKRAETIDLKQDELAKAERTVFVGNVPVAVVTSKATYKKFKSLFSKIGGITSIRFRSISFNEPLPRKIAFAQKKFHNQRETLNAYIVYDTKEVSLKAASFYNGKIFENFHLRVDHINHPSPKDNKRTVFVGNLNFEEMEESLWKYFNHHCDNDVESVRIVRDSKTNLGKGFALVQFKDSLSVNKALLLNDKPLISDDGNKKPRNLRISRAKHNAKPSILSPNHIDNQVQQQKHHKTSKLMHKLNDNQRTIVGRSKILGKADQSTLGSKVIIEGERARKGGKIGKKPRHDKNRKMKKPRIRERSSKFKENLKANVDKPPHGKK